MNEVFYISGVGKIVTAKDYFKPLADANKQDQAAKSVINAVYDNATIVHNLMASRVHEPAASYATYEAYHETAAFTSPLWLRHNNGSGIKYAGQKGAKKGTNGYAWFDTKEDWANAFAHEITKGSNPAGATTIEDYAHRLKLNKYYEDTEDNYTHGLTRARLVLKSIPDEQNASADNIPAKKFSIKDEWNKLNKAEKIGVGAAAVLVTVFIVKR